MINVDEFRGNNNNNRKKRKKKNKNIDDGRIHSLSCLEYGLYTCPT
jgi:hypothetical protein